MPGWTDVYASDLAAFGFTDFFTYLVHCQPIFVVSVGLPALMARRASQGMVVPFIRSETPPWELAGQPLGRVCGIPPLRFIALAKGTAITCELCLDAKCHRLADTTKMG